MKQPLVWKLSVWACVAGWLASVVVTWITLGAGDAWSLLLMNVTTAGTVALVLWRRTTHPTDAFEAGIARGRELEREDQNRRRRGKLRVAR